MNLLHDSAEPEDPIVVSALLWLICFPLAMSIETVRSVRIRRREPRAARYSAGRSTSTQTS